MSLVTSPYTIPAALRRADDILGPNRAWNSINEMQRLFLQIHALAGPEAQSIPEIESISSWNADEINAFLKERGFSIVVGPFDPDMFGTAATLKVLLEWLEEGDKNTLLASDGKSYPSVYMSKNATECTVEDHTNPVIRLQTKTDDLVYLTMLDSPPENEFSMITCARKMATSLKGARYTHVEFPMVDLDLKVELPWMKNLWTTDTGGFPFKVDSAIRQTKLRMNEKGVKIEEAAVLTFVAASLPRIHVIDRPFLMWVDRPNLSLPLFVGYITPEDWKEPAEL